MLGIDNLLFTQFGVFDLAHGADRQQHGDQERPDNTVRFYYTGTSQINVRQEQLRHAVMGGGGMPETPRQVLDFAAQLEACCVVKEWTGDSAERIQAWARSAAVTGQILEMVPWITGNTQYNAQQSRPLTMAAGASGTTGTGTGTGTGRRANNKRR